MTSEKTAEIIRAVMAMSDWEAAVLEAFIAGFQAGRRASGQETAGASLVRPEVSVS